MADRQRENRIDLLRGMSLLLIFIGHAEFTFSLTFQHARGFSDASEIFVMLAGISSALAYYRPGSPLQLERPWKRAFRLYIVHLLLFAVMATISTVAFEAFDQSTWAIDMGHYWNDPVHQGMRAVVLGYMPGNLDILPMYVILLLIAPFVFVLIDRSLIALMALSVLVWLVAGLGHINLPNTAIDGEKWYFDPLSWQIIFIIGVCLGVRMKRGFVPLPYNRVAFVAAAVFAIAAIPVNLLIFLDVVNAPFGDLYHQLVSKTNSGPLRIINVLAILYLAWNIPAVKALADHPSMRLLCFAGRHSLPIFSTGVLLAYFAMVAMRMDPQMPLALQMSILVAGCGVQLALGWALEQKKVRARQVPSHPVVSPAE